MAFLVKWLLIYLKHIYLQGGFTKMNKYIATCVASLALIALTTDVDAGRVGGFRPAYHPSPVHYSHPAAPKPTPIRPTPVKPVHPVEPVKPIKPQPVRPSHMTDEVERDTSHIVQQHPAVRNYAAQQSSSGSSVNWPLVYMMMHNNSHSAQKTGTTTPNASQLEVELEKVSAPEDRVRLADMYAQNGQFDKAQAEYAAAGEKGYVLLMKYRATHDPAVKNDLLDFINARTGAK